jgi:CheY-like chemotaxis protein
MGTRTALVIDDEADIRNYISSILEEHGWTVQTASTAEEGERLVRENRPEVILLDLVMPGQGGIQLFARLRGDEGTSTIPLIMVTGIKEQLNIDWKEIVTRFKTRAPDGFIEKPIDPTRLAQLVENVVSRPERGLQVA